MSTTKLIAHIQGVSNECENCGSTKGQYYSRVEIFDLSLTISICTEMKCRNMTIEDNTKN